MNRATFELQGRTCSRVPHAQNIILEKRQAAETMKESFGKNLKIILCWRQTLSISERDTQWCSFLDWERKQEKPRKTSGRNMKKISSCRQTWSKPKLWEKEMFLIGLRATTTKHMKESSGKNMKENCLAGKPKASSSRSKVTWQIKCNPSSHCEHKISRK